ncbi:hypothetical protein BGI10_00325 [Snodgrassella alvi]|uniref:ABC-three component system protein n=2 Tax=Snodgrassella alvi TaxID=1196083 RepID=UPI0009FF0E08|nr:ABC-three component system protein [Snodgrassella alvi]ORF26497.1 hypothetical protein BGI07_02910 [Snodgrassella alvi]ORF34159.1 hypothetical protein BGI11_06400 [Snodgrassella alvi]ORF34715.1 hypothetical protein BGI10_00325 [Snodgrassella alvi]ORF38045.1 hypothetical protein BGI13_07365 [Snodgrassella alvi]ORF39583.1 hypothetical protein BGI14_06645 [Snodgrassella alvi]
MDEIETVLNKSSAGPQGLGFDYQFYYFVYLSLHLEKGQRIGYEHYDDVCLEIDNTNKILIQLKHTIQTDKTGSIEKMNNLDPRLWSTLNRWIGYIKEFENFLDEHSFRFITNKTENNNKFIEIHKKFIENQDLIYFKDELFQLLNSAKVNQTREYINTMLNLDENKLSEFLLKLDIQLDVNDIEQKIKNYINNHWPVKEEDVDKVYSQLFTKLSHNKYDKIRNRQAYVMRFDEIRDLKVESYSDIYGKISLPDRNFECVLPENLEEQVFIKQLDGIGELGYGPKKSNRIIKYTNLMLKAINHIEWWIEDNFVTSEQIEKFKEECIHIWQVKFDDQYREIEKAIYNDGINIDELEQNICHQAIAIVNALRKIDLTIRGFQNSIGIELNNGYYYFLSNILEIGWHYDWENKFKN